MQTKPLLISAALIACGIAMGVIGDRYLIIGNAQADVVSSAVAQKLVDGLTHGQAQVTKTFAGPGGLTAVVLQDAGHPTLVYVTPDGKDLILAGAIVDGAGKNLMKEDAITAGIVPKATPANALAAEAAKADSVVLGTHGPEIIAFVDPNCIFCHKFYEAAKPLVDAGKLRIRYVIVGFLKPSSAPKAEAILSAKDPAKAMMENEKGFNEEKEEGAIAPDTQPSSAVEKAVQANTQLLASSGEVATPTLIYCDHDEKAVIKHGVPDKNLDDFIKGIGSLNAQGACE